MMLSRYTLPVIVIAQFCCTSLWFASNGILNELIATFLLPEGSLGNITSAVQFGFIAGTLVFAALSIADRFSPSKVFFVCAFFGSIFNLGILWEGHQLWSLLLLRFLTGFFLAGIYPVGMKIAADYFKKGLGRSLGFLVGALVLGTAFPHLAHGFTSALTWKWVIVATSVLALLGGSGLLILIPDGPFRKKTDALQLSAFVMVFKNKEFRQAAVGYFGHMWELYAFWAFIPFAIDIFNSQHPADILNIPFWSFSIIAVGSLGCVISGLLSIRFTEKRIALWSLFFSGLCCLFSPLIFQTSSHVFVMFFLFWGMVVIADSPLFSTMVAQRAPNRLKGTALTIVNCIGFSITIVSIQLLNFLTEQLPSNYIFLVLAIGPLIGLSAFISARKGNI